MIVPPTGPTDARIMLVGEAPGEQEVLRKEPFVGASGQELNRMLHEAGITRSECFITNVCRMRPPANDIEFWIPKSKKEAGPDFVPVDGRLVHPAVASGIEHLRKEIELVKPNIIVAFGNTPLWALTGESGIKTWRGSLLEDRFSGTKLVPTYHPAYILRDWTCRAITVQDLRRVASEQHSRTVTPPSYSFLIRPSFTAIQERLNALFAACQEAPTRLAVDIETRAGHIACLGIATSRVEAFCIPLMCVENPEGYWSAEDEAAIVAALRRVLCHPNAQVIGQNFLYDAQYIYRHWGFVPNFCRDTMLGHHVCFAGDIPKGLGFLSSMYCQYHRYWKDEGKTWDRKTGEEQLWAYNCKDAVATFEVDERIQEQVDRLGLREQHDFQQAMFWPVLEAMLRGCRISTTKRSEFAGQLLSELEARERWFEFLLDHPLNPKSSPQMKALFYEDLKQKPIYSRKKASKGALTLDDEALQTIARREPLLRPLIRKISEYRSLGVFLSTFVNARLGADGRLRCSYNIAGTETFRLSSSKDAFDSGTNLQNVPEGGKDGDDPDELELPNVRVLFVPDPGYEFFNADLDRADLQVVVAESDDNILRQMMREGVDIHAENAKVLGCSRPMAKGWVHATNYGCSPRTAAINFGLLVHAAEQMQKRWFAAHPGILAWHKRTEEFLRAHRFVQNRYGFRRYYFDRVEGLLPEALAWIPQSTVGIYINRVWRRLYERQPQIQVLLQVHDSLAGQFPSTRRECCVRAIREEAAQIVVPYEQPLVIPLSVETSRASWGECE